MSPDRHPRKQKVHNHSSNELHFPQFQIERKKDFGPFKIQISSRSFES